MRPSVAKARRSFMLLIEVLVPGNPFSTHRLDCPASSLAELHVRILPAVGLENDDRIVVTVFEADFQEFAVVMDLDAPDQAHVRCCGSHHTVTHVASARAVWVMALR
jgi:hypothetical protein